MSPMDTGLALATLLHILVLVYWLGGDLGVFYASTIVTDPAKPVAARVAAAQVLAQVDMAPRTAMILAAPTGYMLAVTKGWWPGEGWMIAAAWTGSLAWLAIAWAIHLRHLPPASPWRRIDLVVRWLVVIKLLVIAAGLIPQPFAGDLPLFLRIKLSILAATIVCGLWIRRALVPFGPAFGAMAAQGSATDETNAAIARSLDAARPAVVAIWCLLLCAAYLGVSTPS
jgi:uncharacterized membrane protein